MRVVYRSAGETGLLKVNDQSDGREKGMDRLIEACCQREKSY